MRSKEIALKRSNPIEIGGFDRKDLEAKYAFRFRTSEDLDELWEDDKQSYLKFRIFSTDSLSGFGCVFTQNYHTKRNAIIEGDFEYGDLLDIK